MDSLLLKISTCIKSQTPINELKICRRIIWYYLSEGRICTRTHTHTHTSSHITHKQQEWTSTHRRDVYQLPDAGHPREVRAVMGEWNRSLTCIVLFVSKQKEIAKGRREIIILCLSWWRVHGVCCMFCLALWLKCFIVRDFKTQSSFSSKRAQS